MRKFNYQQIEANIVVHYFEGNKKTLVEVEYGHVDFPGGRTIYERFRIKGDSWSRWVYSSSMMIDSF